MNELDCPELVPLEATVKVERIYGGRHPITCVLGVLGNEEGMRIRDEMLGWICDMYDLITVTQAAPGLLYEYPAIRFAQWYSMEYEVPVLYLHTKGAANPVPIQCAVRNMWRDEFVVHYMWYRDRAVSADAFVGCPLTDGKSTWFNGWMANPAAFGRIDTIAVSDNRYQYENDLWDSGKGVRVSGRLLEDACFDSFDEAWGIVGKFL